MRRKYVASLVILVAVALAAVFVPFIWGPAPSCGLSVICLPQKTESLSLYLFGFGAYSSQLGNTHSYGFCTPANCNDWN